MSIDVTEWQYTAIFFLAPVFAAVVLWRYCRHDEDRKQKRFWPPCYIGAWRIPWIGCAFEFGKAPLYFIEEARVKFGPVFTLKVAGERLTFVTELEDFDHFFLSPSVDFQGAVQSAVSKTASISKESFAKYHTKIHDTLKGRLAAGHLEDFCKMLSTKFDSQLVLRWGQKGSGDLNSLIRSVMYVAVLDNIMGPGVLPTEDEQTFQKLEQEFISYDGEFEYGARLPEFFIRRWAKSKAWLLQQFRGVIEKIPVTDGKQSVLQSLIATVDPENAPNYALLLMWASLANAIPITFWTVAYILSSETILAEIKLEVDQVLGQKKPGEVVIQSDLDKMPAVKRCVLEAIRLHSPGAIVRRVTKNLSIGSFIIPEGDILMLSLYWAHRNPKLFQKPETFDPDRWKSVDFEKNLFLEGFIAFGGGRYQCPGRWFALMEIHLFTAVLIHYYDIQLLQPVPKPSPLHIVGTQQPCGSLNVCYQRRRN